MRTIIPQNFTVAIGFNINRTSKYITMKLYNFFNTLFMHKIGNVIFYILDSLIILTMLTFVHKITLRIKRFTCWQENTFII